ncbi:MAG: hypothetical protein ACK4RX_12825 [Chitinophagaceae bacterium]
MKRNLLLISFFYLSLLSNANSTNISEGIYALHVINKSYSGPLFTAGRFSDNKKIHVTSVNGHLDSTELQLFAKNDSLYLITLYDQNQHYPQLTSKDLSKSYLIVRLASGEYCLQTRKIQTRHIGSLTSEKKINLKRRSVIFGCSLLDIAYTPYYAKIVSLKFSNRENINIGISNFSKNVCVEYNHHRYISKLGIDENDVLDLKYSRSKDSLYLAISNFTNKEHIAISSYSNAKNNARLTFGDPFEGFNAAEHRIHFIRILNSR